MSAVADIVPIDQGATDRRAEWREGHAAGLKHGSMRVMQSPIVENLAIEITILRATVAVLSDTVVRLEDEVIWYRDGYEAFRDAWNSRRSAA